jgi:hypothetical protein
MSWRSMVKTGLSEVIGSWKIMPISLPRIDCISAVSALVTSITSPLPRANLRLPPAILPPPNSTRRISDSEVTDLPEPDSPTTQTVSPGLIEKLTSSTPTTVPPSVWNSTRSLSTATIGWVG